MSTLTIEVKPWIAAERQLHSRIIEVHEVLGQSEKAIRVRATAVVRESERCLNCGRAIDNPVSRLVGYGPICSDNLGIPRDFAPEDIETIRAQVRASERSVVAWLPRASITVLEGTIPTAPPIDSVARVRLRDGKLVAATPFSAKDLVRSVPGARWSAADKTWWWPASEHTAAELVGRLRTARTLTGVEVEPEVEALIAARRQGEVQASHKLADEAEVPTIDLDPLGQPEWWSHQRRAFHAARGQTAYMLAIGMGGGKSRVAVDLVRDADDKRVLILCPKNVVGVWPKQFRLYGGEAYEVIAPRKGTVAKRAAEITSALERNVRTGGPVVVVVNYESAWREPLDALLLGVAWDRVILDESHRVKSSVGKASRFCAKLRPVAKRRLCLTGTPMPHSPLDVFGQYRFLDPGVFGGSFVTFRSKYALMGGYGGYEVLGYQREDELSEKVYRIAYRIADEELDAVLGLEEPIHETRTCALSPEARRIYEKFWTEMEVDITGGTVSAKNALVKLLRLQQMTSGLVPVEEITEEGDIERATREVDTAKRDALEDLLEDVPPGEPVVVFCRFTHDLDNVAKVAAKLGRSYAELSGRRKDALTEDSTLAPGIEVAGVQIQSGGVGIDLSASHYCVFYSVGFSLGDYDQALKRTHRPGQHHRVAYYHLVAADTVDETVYEALATRKNVVDYVLGLTH